MRHAPCRQRRSRAVAVAAVAVLALAGCGSDDGEPKQGSRPVGGDTASAAGSETGGETGSETGSETDGPSSRSTSMPVTSDVELLETGAGPRRLLEVEVADGHVERTTTSLRLTMDYGTGTITLPVSMPFTTTVTGVEADGFTADVVYGRASVAGGSLPDGTGPMVDQALDLVEGTTAHVSYGRNGILRSSELDLGEDAPDLVARLLDNIATQGFAVAVPYPDEEVGVGARWRASTTMQIGGVEVVVTSTYELARLTDGGYVVEVRAEQRAEPGPAVGGGKVVESVSSGGGTVTGRPGLVAPARAITRIEGRSTVDVGGQEVTSSYTGTMEMTTR